MRVTQPRRSSRRAQGLLRLTVPLCLLAAVGCNPQSGGGGTVTPGGNGAVSDGPGPDGPQEGDNIGDLEARLQRLGQRQVKMSTTSDASFNVCEDLCSLASSICSVKEKLCLIADEHPGEEEYQQLCRKAELQCSEAEDSCVACVEARQSRPETLTSSPPAE